ncbi:MAG: response regulator transcription factor [Desulfosarcina sp.]|nr:response regulator transcription factor [Desulfobacterales bacterium]
MKVYKIVLADDHVILREGIKKIINESKNMEVVGEASDGLMLLKILKRTMTDMVILDVSMPKLRGIEAAQEIRKRFPELAILFLSMHKSREYLQKALAAGAKGYIVKEDSGNELIHAIETIRSGGSYLSPMMMKELSDDPIGICRGMGRWAEDPLTPRECQILQLIADGKTSKEIAQLLFISIHTVHNHRKNIKHKLAIRKNTDLVKYALKHGYAL